MSLFAGHDAQYGQQQQPGYPNQQQLQLLHHQQQLLLQEIALKKAQLVQHQQQQQLALFHQRQQHAQLQKEQHQQMLNQQSQFYTQALQYQVSHQAKLQQHAAKMQAATNYQQQHQQHALQHQQQHHHQQQRQQLVESPSLESDHSDETNKRYDDIEEWEIPPKDLILKINQQVEYYFSNEYLTRDAYFLRQIRRKREGYLSMKLITNFKKVRKLVKDPRITSYCLRHSNHLQVNEDGTKVRRKFPIPENLSRFVVSRSLLIRSLPHRLASIECLMSIFYQFGDITSVRVLRPGKEIPHDLRDGLGKLTLTDIVAVVEFETTESAANAFHRFSINNEICVEKVAFELNVTLMGSGMEEELDSGCGSSSSGDERDSQSADWTKLLVQGGEGGENLDDDYEAYMRSMRDEKCEENKEDVPDVIAALMDEYGAMCTVPSSSPRCATNTTLATLARSDNCRQGQTVRKPAQSVWATYTTAFNEDEAEDQAAIQNILIGSALAGYGQSTIDELSQMSIDADDFMMPPTGETTTAQKPQMIKESLSMPQNATLPMKNAWAAVARG